MSTRNDEIRAAAASGRSMSGIAREHKITRQRVHQIVTDDRRPRDRPAPPPWLAEAVALAAAGRPLSAVARAAGVSRWVAARQLALAGVEIQSTDRPAQPWLATAIALYQEGQTLEQVSAAIGVTASRVRRHLLDAGISLRRPGGARPTKTPPPWIGDAARRYLAGEPATVVAHDHNVACNTLLVHLRRAGVEIRRPGRPNG